MRRLAEQERELLVRWWREGALIQDLCDHFQRSEKCLRAILSYLCGAVRQRRATEAEKGSALRLCRQGLNDCEVSRRTGVERSKVQRWRVEAGVKANGRVKR